VAFGKLALIQSLEAGSKASMNNGSSRLDDDGDLVPVAINKPEEWHCHVT
jgi:hypothetical protein